MGSTTIATGQVRLFAARLHDAAGDRLLARAPGLLSPAERAARDRFVFARDRELYAAAHGLTRLALSRCADVDPAAWRFDAGPHGKPEIAAPATELRFNLSHTAGMVVCAVTRAADVGVDVENVGRGGDLAAVARSVFAAAELATLDALADPDAWRRRFFEYWTLKEAYIKARGLGLALPLADFWFTLAPPAPPRLDLAPTLDDRGERWRFHQISLPPCFQLAAAVERGAAEPTFLVEDMAGALAGCP